VRSDEEHELLVAARAGDGGAFDALVAGHRAALHLHCYRMLGSFHDAEEATQEALLRAWRKLDTFESRAPLGHWLYRIATTTCLNMITSRGRQPSTTEIPWLEPYPDDLLDPAGIAERRESVRLAFIAALQALPATQRAALILRDVLAWPAAEVADLLDTSVAAVNSLLQRARSALPLTTPSSTALVQRDREVARRFVEAWNHCDIEALASLLREDAILRMPPERVQIVGRAAVTDFFATVPAGGRLDTIGLMLVRANDSWAVAAYLPSDSGVREAYGLMVLSTESGSIAEITGFPDPGLFKLFGLPAVFGEAWESR